jgi:hypothetical protein
MTIRQGLRLQTRYREARRLPPFALAQGLAASPFANQTDTSRTKSASIALSVASKNVAENVPRLILFAMLASVSFKRAFPVVRLTPDIQYHSLGSRIACGRLAT